MFESLSHRTGKKCDPRCSWAQLGPILRSCTVLGKGRGCSGCQSAMSELSLAPATCPLLAWQPWQGGRPCTCRGGATRTYLPQARPHLSSPKSFPPGAVADFALLLCAAWVCGKSCPFLQLPSQSVSFLCFSFCAQLYFSFERNAGNTCWPHFFPFYHIPSPRQ